MGVEYHVTLRRCGRFREICSQRQPTQVWVISLSDMGYSKNNKVLLCAKILMVVGINESRRSKNPKATLYALSIMIRVSRRSLLMFKFPPAVYHAILDLELNWKDPKVP
jgi:hypothetical protein